MGLTIIGRTIAIRYGLAKHALALVLVSAALLSPAPAPAQTFETAPLSPGDTIAYRAAFLAMHGDAWDAALAAAAGASDPVLAKVLEGMNLAREEADASFTDIVGFIIANPAWPYLSNLRRAAERQMPGDLSFAFAAAWFADYPPLTFDAVMRYGEALDALGRTERLNEFVNDRWVAIRITEAQQAAFLDRFGGLLADGAHEARLEALLWANRATEARRIIPFVDRGLAALANARIRLAARRRSGVDRAVAAVPAALAGDGGLVYERVRWRRRADLTEGAVELLAQQPENPTNLRRWWTERNILVRRLFADAEYQGAYDLVAAHRQEGGIPFAQAEWLAGWLALRFNGRPDLAQQHFRRLFDSVTTPISLARGAYWVGRSYEAMSDPTNATNWYRLASLYDTTFYGQLAAGKLNEPSVARLPTETEVPIDVAEAFAVSEMTRIVLALDQIDEEALSDRFLRTMSRRAQDDPVQLALTTRLAVEIERRHIAVRNAKRAVSIGPPLVQASYPILPLPLASPVPETALLLALIRQESEFRVDAVSRSGARGLMQLMPATARRMSRALGVQHSLRRLTSDPDHNVRLGSEYLARMLDRFDGSYILAVASYNAGPSNVEKWIEEWGDPRDPGVDTIDWIESMPFYETRNYVQRVLENAQVYRLRRGEPPTVGSLERDLAR